MTLKVQEYLKTNHYSKLKEEFGVNFKEYEDRVVLNYCQIESPKNEITNECRGLILDVRTNEVISRSFDRFFNYGEQFTQNLDLNNCISHQKIDGSLIKLYKFKGTWYVSTRGTAFAESNVNGFELTFKGMVLKALNLTTEEEFQTRCNQYLDDRRTYICEITGVENRVVTRYVGYTLWFLACRSNVTPYQYMNYRTNTLQCLLKEFGLAIPETFAFNTIEDCVLMSKMLPDLQEGYVLYTTEGVPVCKVKSPAYVAVHHIRGEGLNPKRIAMLVVLNEVEEYLSYFPEERDMFVNYLIKWKFMCLQGEHTYDLHKGIENQKDFALKVKDDSLSGIHFKARKLGISFSEALCNSEPEMLVKILLKEMESHV